MVEELKRQQTPDMSLSGLGKSHRSMSIQQDKQILHMDNKGEEGDKGVENMLELLNQHIITQAEVQGDKYETASNYSQKVSPAQHKSNAPLFKKYRAKLQEATGSKEDDVLYEELQLLEPHQRLVSAVSQIDLVFLELYKSSQKPNTAIEKLGLGLLAILSGADSSLGDIGNAKEAKRDWHYISSYMDAPKKIQNMIQKIPYQIENQAIRTYHAKLASDVLQKGHISRDVIRQIDEDAVPLYNLVEAAILYTSAYTNFVREVNQKIQGNQVRNPGQGYNISQFSKEVQDILKNNRKNPVAVDPNEVKRLEEGNNGAKSAGLLEEMQSIQKLEKELQVQNQELKALQKQQKLEELKTTREEKERQRKMEVQDLEEKTNQWKTDRQYDKKKAVVEKLESDEIKNDRRQKLYEDRLVKYQLHESKRQLEKQEIEQTQAQVEFNLKLEQDKREQQRLQALESAQKAMVDKQYKSEVNNMEKQVEMEERLWSKSQKLSAVQSKITTEKQQVLKTLDVFSATNAQKKRK